MDQPTLIVIGGANGSGKTTLAREYISVENLPYLGADGRFEQWQEMVKN